MDYLIAIIMDIHCYWVQSNVELLKFEKSSLCQDALFRKMEMFEFEAYNSKIQVLRNCVAEQIIAEVIAHQKITVKQVIEV